MSQEKLSVGFACTGSFCTFGQILPVIEETARRYETVIPILSEYSAATDTRFGRAADFAAELERVCGRAPLCTIRDVEPIGPEQLLDLLVVAPCTGNTLAKLAAGITDTAVTMAVKAHLRNGRPVLLAISTNDGLAVSLRNLGEVNCRKNIYLVPFRQDQPFRKPNSLVADMTLIPAAAETALKGRQLQPVLLGARVSL